MKTEILNKIIESVDERTANGIRIAMMVYGLDKAGADMDKVEKHVKKKIPNYKEKTCTICGKKFKPRYGAQTKCDDCANTAKALADLA